MPALWRAERRHLDQLLEVQAPAVKRRVSVSWTATREGQRHAFIGRRRLTLCQITVDERWTRGTEPRCPACLAELERLEAMPATR